MDNLNDLKAIWLTAKTDNLPDSGEMLRIVKKYRNKTLQKKTMMIVFALATAALMVMVMFIYQSTMLSTRIGEVMMLTTAAILAYTNMRSIGRFYRLNDCNNKEFIQFLEKTRQNQIYYYQKTQVAGLAFCSVGLMLYLFEMVHTHILWMIITYLLTSVYLAVMWFIVRPRVFKKHSAKLTELIKRTEALSKQLE